MGGENKRILCDAIKKASMSVRAPPELFSSDNSSITPPLDDGWTYLNDPHCRPWRVMVLNLSLSDFAGCPGSLADLAYANASGEPLPHAEALGQLLGLLATQPSEVKVGKGKNAVALTPTFTEEGACAQQKTQLVIEPLRSPLPPFLIVGLRLHVLLFHAGRNSFPTLTSTLWQRVITANHARRAREVARQRPPAMNPDPAAASRYVVNMATIGKMWRCLIGDDINGTRRSLQEWVNMDQGSVTNVTFGEAVVTLRMELYVHRLSPEWLLRLGPHALLLRAPMETSVDQLDKERYFQKGSISYSFPDPADCLVFAGTTGGAFHARFPAKLCAELQHAHEEFGGAGQSFHGTRLADELPAGPLRKRRRNADLDVDAESEESDDSVE